MLSSDRKYHSKILLIGEYAVLLHGKALASPCHEYYGQWNMESGVNLDFDGFLSFIKSNERLSKNLNYKEFQSDLNSGLYFDSNIPIGYGVGSSGALCAGIYDDYSQFQEEDLDSLRLILSEMESYFHGSSSGLDPLVSYLDKAVLLEGTDIQIIPNELPLACKSYRITLVDSGIQRVSKDLIKIFNDDCLNLNYQHGFRDEIMKYNSLAIQGILEINHELFIDSWKNISINSLKYFNSMIPDHIKKLWLEGLDTGNEYYKLCGAGGGGFFLKMEFNELNLI